MSESLSTEVCGAVFRDSRLSDRLSAIVDQLGSMPTASIPAATKGRAEMEATYRFFDNPKVNPQAISEPHRQATIERIGQSAVGLLVQDTTELNLTRPNQQVEGAGPLRATSQSGAFYHPLVAFSGEGLMLGTVWSKQWSREKLNSGRTDAEKEKHKRDTCIEDKESMRWLEGLREARTIAHLCPRTQCVCIGDSESDIYELFAEPRNEPDKLGENGAAIHLLIRACQNRQLLDSDDKLLETVRQSPCLYRCSIDVSSRKQKISTEKGPRRRSRDARIAEVEIRAMSVVLKPPPRADRKLPEVRINAVLVEETNPPEGEHPIRWLLLTTLPIETLEQVQAVVGYYCIRWQIEIYFRTLKSGCRIEERYFERMHRISNCIAVYAIVAWKILFLCRLGRDCPDIDCEVVFTPSEWQSVYMTVRRKEPPQKRPTLNEIIRMIASLGGYVIRAKTKPGTQTLWLGLQRLHDLSTAWDAFGPGAADLRKTISEQACVVR